MVSPVLETNRSKDHCHSSQGLVYNDACLQSSESIRTQPIDIAVSESKPITSQLPSLQIRTDFQIRTDRPNSRESDTPSFGLLSGSYPRRTPSLRALIAPPISNAGSFSPASFISSPQLNAMADITPLPSPIGGASPWQPAGLPSLSRTSSTASRSASSLRLSESSQMIVPPVARSHTKSYAPLEEHGEHGENSSSANQIRYDSPSNHARNRSLSDYAPSGRVSVPRPIAVSGSGPSMAQSSSIDSKSGLQREQYLAVHRGIALPVVRPPSPPRSSGSGYGDSDSEPMLHRPVIYSVSWYRFANEDEEWDPVKGKGLEGARECVEGLLKRNTKRKTLDEIAAMPWVQEGIKVINELKRGDKEVP
ncbi:hypothetical protein N7495_001456 [Penicillium taxi]|uniref:uncharacterized protein n=1 Tax=Penicillium taxi TaxID=168475 RepID=UPI00254550F8|nr:uncharacterized protein N7495_001456 [Penicillium taxi]KAJ5908774.1 hypothetical protein N7495_001456 [Penicillium taxi]